VDIILCGTPSGRATFSRFKPYRGSDVKADEYTQVDIEPWGRVWAYLEGDEITLTPGDATEGTTSKVKLRNPTVRLLGWGVEPYIDFGSLPQLTQEALVRHHFGLLPPSLFDPSPQSPASAIALIALGINTP
jgi:hypothetical protein